MNQVTNLRRAVGGVSLFAATDDPAKVERIQRVLDAAMKALSEKNARAGQRETTDWLETLLGKR